LEISPDLVTRYPWLPSLKEYRSDLNTLDSIKFIENVLSADNNEGLRIRIYEFFKAALENLEHFSYYKIDELNIYLYLSIQMLIYLLNNRSITNRVANLYSKITYSDLTINIERNNYSDLFEICKDLKFKLNYHDEPEIFRVKTIKGQKEKQSTNISIYFTDFLKLASNLRDDNRRLINNPLRKGYVFITPHTLARLLQEYVRKKFISDETEDQKSHKKFKQKALKFDKLKELYENIEAIWDLKKDEYKFPVDIGFKEGAEFSDFFPPCILEIISKAQESQNLPHTERLVILFFLHAIEYPTENIIQIFSHLPDFDEKKTRYQVEFAKRKGYIPHSCMTLKSLNLCMAQQKNDKICLEGYYSIQRGEERTISHPLSYIRIKQYRFEKEKNRNNNQQPVKNE
jgi:DNA primase large subunit